MNKILTRTTLAALCGLLLGGTAFGDSFHSTYERNLQPTPRAANRAAKATAAENDFLRFVAKVAALQRPTISVYSNVQPPAPAPVPVVAPTTENVVNITGSNVVINN